MTDDGVNPIGKLILVVDDEPDVLRFQAAILEDAGFEVMTASDGNEALERIEERPPDLVSLDLVMPGRSGIRFLHSLRRKRAWATIPVIIVTGHAHDDLGRSHLRDIDAGNMITGPQVCLEKPVRPEVYVRAVMERLGIADRGDRLGPPASTPVRGEIDAMLDRADPETLETVRAMLRGEASPMPAGPVGESGPVALVIDDEPDVAATIAVMLEDGGYVTHVTTDAREAVDRAKDLRPDLITLDVDMPGMSGVEVYAALRAEPDLARVPVIVVTGVDEDLRPRFTGQPGLPDVDGYLGKPVVAARLLETAEAVRSTRRTNDGEDRPMSDPDRKTILVVEDEDDVRAFLTALFEDHDYHAVSARDGDEGFRLLEETRPDLVTLDIQMPGETGTRFWRRMSKHAELSSTPIIVISGVAGRHLAVGDPVAVIDKPIDRDALLLAVQEALA